MPKFTKSGKPTAVGDVEGKLKAEYPDNPGAVYGTLNKIGLMKGNQTTAKGARAAKHPLGKKPKASGSLDPKNLGYPHDGSGVGGGLAVHDSMSGTGIHDVKHTRRY